MAWAIYVEPMLQRVAARLNPCRWCGDRPVFRRRHSDYTFEERIAVMCPCRVEWMLWPEPLEAWTTDRFLDDMRRAVFGLRDFWNERHDGPGFIAGLA